MMVFDKSLASVGAAFAVCSLACATTGDVGALFPQPATARAKDIMMINAANFFDILFSS
jgi:hypothetical protein